MFPLSGVQGAHGSLMHIWDSPDISKSTIGRKLNVFFLFLVCVTLICSVKCGVRPGGVLSPLLFNVYLNVRHRLGLAISMHSIVTELPFAQLLTN